MNTPYSRGHLLYLLEVVLQVCVTTLLKSLLSSVQRYLFSPWDVLEMLECFHWDCIDDNELQ